MELCDSIVVCTIAGIVIYLYTSRDTRYCSDYYQALSHSRPTADLTCFAGSCALCRPRTSCCQIWWPPWPLTCSGVRKFTSMNATEQLIVLAFQQPKLPQLTGWQNLSCMWTQTWAPMRRGFRHSPWFRIYVVWGVDLLQLSLENITRNQLFLLIYVQT